jgi:hypothetical protein
MQLPKSVWIFSSVLLAAYFLILWLIDYSALGIPEFIPGTSYQTYTIAMFVVMALVLVIFQKRVLKFYPETSIVKLTLLTVLICFVSQAIYQLIRQTWVLRHENNNKVSDFTVSLASLTILSLFIGLSIAFELKKVNGFLKVLGPVFVFGLLVLLKKYFPNTTW